jgi:hypothetical protein
MLHPASPFQQNDMPMNIRQPDFYVLVALGVGVPFVACDAFEIPFLDSY